MSILMIAGAAATLLVEILSLGGAAARGSIKEVNRIVQKVLMANEFNNLIMRRGHKYCVSVLFLKHLLPGQRRFARPVSVNVLTKGVSIQ